MNIVIVLMNIVIVLLGGYILGFVSSIYLSEKGRAKLKQMECDKDVSTPIPHLPIPNPIPYQPAYPMHPTWPNYPGTGDFNIPKGPWAGGSQHFA